MISIRTKDSCITPISKHIHIIDVGGSFTDFCYLSTEPPYFQKVAYPTPRDEYNLCQLIKQNVNVKLQPLIALGLPGPFTSKNSCVYMPPLDYTVDLGLLRDEIGALRLAAMNDSVLTAIINNSIYGIGHESRANILSLTIGTSFGSTLIMNANDKPCYVPIELAHIPIPASLDLGWIDKDVRQLFNNKNASSLFSAAGMFISCQGNLVEMPRNISESIFRYEDVHFIKDNFQNLRIESITDWANSLKHFCLSIFPGTSLIYLSGGPLASIDNYHSDFYQDLAKLNIIPILPNSHQKLCESFDYFHSQLETFLE